MDSNILHVDLNSFYASVECLYNPSIRDLPVAVCGDPQARHGIVLTRNQIAKQYNVKTAQPVWQAKQLCPNLVIVKPNFDRYLKFSRLAREIYYEYTEQVEPFGIDEAWLDVTNSRALFGSGEEIAHKIRNQIFYELGITVSVGVSYNKVFAKLGSDYKKPNAVTVFSKDNYKEKVWPLPVNDLLYVGRATTLKLAKLGIYTIGELANFDSKLLYRNLGKVGLVLSQYANGLDYSQVARYNENEGIVKSIGNSTTTHRDLNADEDVWVIFCMLAESVASRLRDNGLKCKTIQIYVRDKNLETCEHQAKLPTPTYLSTEISKQAMQIFKAKYSFEEPLRSVGVRACDLVPEYSTVQLSLLYDHEHQRKMEELEKSIDDLRNRYGHYIIRKGIMLTDDGLSRHNAKEHTIHPESVFHSPMPK